MPTEAELQLAAAQNHAAARLYTKRVLDHIDALGGNMTALAALDQPPPPPVEPPVVDPPIIVDPPSIGDYGCKFPVAELADWVFQPVTSAGRPASVPEFGSGAVMQKFRFHPRPDDGYTHVGILGGSERGVIGAAVRDSIVDGYRPWGGNRKAVQSAHFKRNTTRGTYGTGQHIEHGRYLGVEGPSPARMDEYEASLFALDTDAVDALGLTGIQANAAILFDGELFVDNPGAGYQETNRDVHKGAIECSDPATFDADAGATWINATKFVGCGMGHHAATVSGFAIQMAGPTGDIASRANKAWVMTNVEVEGFSPPGFDMKPSATLVMLALKRGIYIEGGAYRRGDMGSTTRSLLKFGDQYGAKFPGWSQPGAPATDGAPLVCRDFALYSDMPTVVEVLLMDGTPFEWRGVKYESGSAPVRLLVNGADVGDITKEIIS